MAMSYFILVGTMSLASLTVHEVRNEKISQEVSEYIICSSDGNCSRSSPNDLSLGAASDFTTFMLACFPLVTFFLGVNLSTCKKVLRSLGKFASKCAASCRRRKKSSVKTELQTVRSEPCKSPAHMLHTLQA